jgi:hypothetical protein
MDIHDYLDEATELKTDDYLELDRETFSGSGIWVTHKMRANILKWKKAIVSISSAQILAMNATPIVLLPSLAVDEYYSLKQIRLEFLHGGVTYSLAGDTLFLNMGDQDVVIDKYLIADSAARPKRVVVINEFNSQNVTAGVSITNSQNVLLSSLTLSSVFVPTLGNGTMRAVIYYAVETFGA